MTDHERRIQKNLNELHDAIKRLPTTKDWVLVASLVLNIVLFISFLVFV